MRILHFRSSYPHPYEYELEKLSYTDKMLAECTPQVSTVIISYIIMIQKVTRLFLNIGSTSHPTTKGLYSENW